MADLPVEPVLNYGQMLGSYGDSLATQDNAATSRLSALAQLPQTRAQTALTQAQTAAANINTQKTSMLLQAIQQNMNPPSVNDQSASAGMPQNGAAGSGDIASSASGGSGRSAAADAIADAGLDPAAIMKHAEQQFNVKDVWTPQELQALSIAKAQEAIGMTGAQQNVKMQHDARIQNLRSQAEVAASEKYDDAYAVSSDDAAGHRIATISRYNPDAATAIQRLADKKGWTPEEADQFAKHWADEVGSSVHRFSARPIKVGSDGIARDEQTGQPVLGAIPEGLSAKDYSDIYKSGFDDVHTFRNGQEAVIKRYDFASDGKLNPQQYANAIANQRINAQRGAAAGNSTTNNSPTGAAPSAAPAQGSRQGVAAPAASQGQNIKDPALRDALNDTDYDWHKPVTPGNQKRDPGDQTTIDQQKEAKKNLYDQSNEAIRTASLNNMYLDAARQALDPNAVLPQSGPVAALIAKFSSVAPLGHDAAAQRQELSKYLLNAAVQSGKANFGKNYSTSENDIQTHELSPSADMNTPALLHLIDKGKLNNQYNIDTAHRVGAYISAGKDAQRFDDWNNAHFDRSTYVNGKPTGEPAAPAARPGQVVNNPQPAASSAQSATEKVLPANRNLTPAQAQKLPKGTTFTGQDGQQRWVQ